MDIVAVAMVVATSDKYGKKSKSAQLKHNILSIGHGSNGLLHQLTTDRVFLFFLAFRSDLFVSQIRNIQKRVSTWFIGFQIYKLYWELFLLLLL